MKRENTPIWAYLPFASVETRKGAYALIWCNVLCSLYCVPWSQYFIGVDWVAKIFVIDHWYWFAAMIAITVWYCLSFRRIIGSNAWPERSLDSDD